MSCRDSDAARAAANGILNIDLGALARNYARMVRIAAPAGVAGVVKANAYGLGIEHVAPVLRRAGCDHFFVAMLTEALDLRRVLGDDPAIVVLNGLAPGAERLALGAGVVPVLNCLDQAIAWAELAGSEGRRLPAIVQVDTGMTRLGFAFDEAAELRSRPQVLESLDIRHLMTHLASADDPHSLQSRQQIEMLKQFATGFPGVPLCIGNSHGIGLGPDYHGALVRPGIALYGASAPQVEPVVSLSVRVVQNRSVPAGVKVGYNATFVTQRPMTLATIAAGYADGLPRSLSGRGAVYLDGRRLPIVGRVSMDSTIIDVSDLPEGRTSPGTLVQVIGPDQTIDAVARDAGTISYEVLTSLGSRYWRDYVGSLDGVP